MNLEQISAALTDQYPKGSVIDLDRREQRLERFGQIAFGGFGIVIAIAIIGIIYAVITKMILAGDQPWAGVLLVAFLIFAALTLTYVVFNEDLKEKRKALRKQPALEPVAELVADTNKLLNQPPADQVASVIEDTTELLPVKNKTRRL